MKKVFLVITILFFSLDSFSQSPQLWGMTGVGGTNGRGTIFKIYGDGTGYQTAYSFDTLTGATPQGNLVFCEGKFYGVTISGGLWNRGVIFSFDPQHSVFTDLFDFDNTTGYQNLGSLIVASNNVLYGMNSAGGIFLRGSIFSFDINSLQFSMVHEFINSDGYWPTANLVEADQQTLYGLTAFGGTYGLGVLFSLNTTNNNLLNLYSFSQGTGGDPQGALIKSDNGKFYGLTSGGGHGNHGVLYSYDPDSNLYLPLHYFDSINGRLPLNSLLEADNGLFYGVAMRGGINDLGILFSFDPLTNTFSKLLDFNGFNGKYPRCNLMQASDSIVYGLSFQGGIHSGGTIFSYNPSTNIFSKIIDMGQTSYGGPIGKLLEVDSTLYNYTNDIDRKQLMYISPNPATSSLTIHLAEGSGDSEITIFTVMGKKVYSTLLKNCSLKLNIDFDPGIYFVRVETRFGSVTQKLMID